MELKCNFILPRGTLRHVIQGNIKPRISRDVKGQRRPVELGRAPIPPLKTEFFVHHRNAIILLEEFGDLVLVRLPQTPKAHESSALRENAEAPRARKSLPGHNIYIAPIQLLQLSCFIVLKYDVGVGQFETTFGLKCRHSW